MIVELPTIFPYKDDKTVPQSYDYNIVSSKASEALKQSISIIGVIHFTRNRGVMG